jgi:hypothetical protein
MFDNIPFGFHIHPVSQNDVNRTSKLNFKITYSFKGNFKLYLMFFQINCRQFELAIFTGNHSLWALFTFMKIPTFTFYCFFA